MNDFAGMEVLRGGLRAVQHRLVGWEVENLTGFGNLSG